jgi:mercuric ion binding protein
MNGWKRWFAGAMLVSSFAFGAGQQIKVQVNGMVCSFCAQGLTKKFGAHEAVEGIRVDLDHKLVELSLKEGKSLSDDTVKALIQDAGFNVEKVTRQ